MIVTYKALSDVRWYAYPTQEHAVPEGYHAYGELKHLGEDLAVRRTTWNRTNGTRMPDSWEYARILKTHRRTETKTDQRLAEIPTNWKKFTPYCRWQSFQVLISKTATFFADRGLGKLFYQRGVVNLDEVTHLCSSDKMLHLHIDGKPHRKQVNERTKEWVKEHGWSVLSDYYHLSGITAEDGTLRDDTYLCFADGYSAKITKISPRIKIRKDGSALCEPWS